MERVLNPKHEKQTIYDIYRACRLCGAGAGYKMPIIQSVVDLEGDGIELKQKIKECVQIEVHHTDRMPPLICELCVDKVNEFYEFLDMCKQNNRRTRLRLGLPLQTITRDSIDSENCILGVTEHVFNDSDAEQTKKKKKIIKNEPIEVKTKTDIEINKKEAVNTNAPEEPAIKRQKGKTKEPDVRAKKEPSRPSPKPEAKPRARESRESSEEPRWSVISRGRRIVRSPSPNPRRTTRQNAEPNVSPQESFEEPQWSVVSRVRHIARSPSPSPKRTTRQNAELNVTTQLIETTKLQPLQNSLRNVLKKNEESLAVEKSKLKRPREKETKIETQPPNKKAKILVEPIKVKPGPMSSKNVQKESKEIPVPKLIPKTPAKSAPKKDLKPTPAPTSKTTPKALPSKPLPAKVSPAKPTPAPTPSKPVPSKAKPSKETPFKSDPPYCEICKIYLKTAHGSMKHNNIKHAPTFTSPRHACNACELWFSSVDEANSHHRNHRNHNIPYKCTRCYGYFKLQQSYDEHFGNALCLSVYEVPDVKCWECWRTFPTNRLMEEHRCLGEDGRPGGNCKKCNRSYALLKNLVKHESTCTHKKKGDITIDPEVQARLLPMQVRVAKCDSLLKTKGHVDTSKIPRAYGLDSKCDYPYLSHIKVKSEPTTKTLPHMVSINQDVKEEFGDSNAHWDSGSDVSDSSQKQVSTLSTISLNSIIFKKLIGKSPQKRKVDDETFESSNDFGMGRRIDNIIDTLSNDEAQTSCDSDSILDKDVVTTKNAKEQSRDCKKDKTVLKDDGQTSCDDSILDENGVRKVEDNKISDDTVDKSDTAVKHDDIAERNDDTDEKHDDTDEKHDDTAEKADDTNKKHDDTTEIKDNTPMELDSTAEKLVDTSEKLDCTSVNEIKDNTPMELDSTAKKLDGITEKLDDTSEKVDDTSEKVDCTSENHNKTPEKSDTLEKLDSISEKPNNTLEKRDCEAETLENLENSNIPDDFEKEANLTTENDKESVREKDSKTIEENSLSKDEEIPDGNTENSNIDSCQIDEINTQDHEGNETNVDDNNQTSNLEEPQGTENCSKNDTQLSILVDSKNQLSNHVSNELLNSNSDNNDNKMDNDEQNDVTDNDNDVINHENAKDSENATEIEENLSKIDEITNKILNENQNFDFNQTLTKTEDLSNVNDDHTSYNDENHPKSDGSTDTISLNSIGNEIPTEKQDKFNVNDLNEDDRKLMAELDAQIGENDQKTNDNDQSLIGCDQKFRQNHQESINQKAHEGFIENDQKTDLITNENDPKQNDQRTKDFLIDNLLKKQDNDLKSLELDSISDDEFNFDI